MMPTSGLSERTTSIASSVLAFIGYRVSTGFFSAVGMGLRAISSSGPSMEIDCAFLTEPELGDTGGDFGLFFSGVLSGCPNGIYTS